MITREEADALLAHAPDYWLAPGDGSIEDVQGTTIAHVHEHANLRTVARTGETHSSADARLLAAAPDLARTVVALYDERDAEVARGAHWRQAHDEADRLRDLAVAVADRAEQERDALARTVVALRADLDDKCSALTTAWDENARLALELRRLRAASL